MKSPYAVLLAIASLASTGGVAQSPCLTDFTTPAGQTMLPNASWTAINVPTSMSVPLNVTTAAGSNVANVTGCNATLVGATISGPNFPGGTTVVSTTCPSVTLSLPATSSGSAAHTFTMSGYAFNYPPQNPGIPATLNCSVSPAQFSTPICAGEYFTYYMCTGNDYTFSLCNTSSTWNSSITITTTTGQVLASGADTYDDDGCGVAAGHATLTYTPTVNGIYRVRVFEDGCLVNGISCGDLHLSSLPHGPAPGNDEPENAIDLPVGSTCDPVESTTEGASQSTGTVPVTPTNCGPAPCTTGSGQFAGMDVWFAVVLPATGEVAIATELLTAQNLAMAAYEGDAGSLVQIGGPTYCGSCNDNEAPGIPAPFLILTGLAPGSTIHVRVWPNGGLANSGSFSICAREVDFFAASDCAGSLPLCGDTLAVVPVMGTGLTVDLSENNDGCLAGEHQGVWFTATTNSNGTMAFTIQVAPPVDYDFAIWGPFIGTPFCPQPSLPLRCSWSGMTGSTGLNYTSLDLSEGAGGDRWVRYIDALAGETYLIYVDNWSMNGLEFDLIWDNEPDNLIACVPLEVSAENGASTILIRPNPVNDQVIINAPFLGEVEWTITDATGRIVMNERSNWTMRATIGTAWLASGTYVLHVRNAQGNYSSAVFVKE